MKITEEKKKILEKYFECDVYDKEEFEQKRDDGYFDDLDDIYDQTFELDGLVFVTDILNEDGIFDIYNYEFMDYIVTKLGNLNRECIFMLSGCEEIMMCKSWDSKTTTPLQIENNIFDGEVRVKKVTIESFGDALLERSIMYLQNNTQYALLYGSLKQSLNSVLKYTLDDIHDSGESMEAIQNIKVEYINEDNKPTKYNHIPIYGDKVISSIEPIL